jgi:hypothetical protein
MRVPHQVRRTLDRENYGILTRRRRNCVRESILGSNTTGKVGSIQLLERNKPLYGLKSDEIQIPMEKSGKARDHSTCNSRRYQTLAVGSERVTYSLSRTGRKTYSGLRGSGSNEIQLKGRY